MIPVGFNRYMIDSWCCLQIYPTRGRQYDRKYRHSPKSQSKIVCSCWLTPLLCASPPPTSSLQRMPRGLVKSRLNPIPPCKWALPEFVSDSHFGQLPLMGLHARSSGMYPSMVAGPKCPQLDHTKGGGIPRRVKSKQTDLVIHNILKDSWRIALALSRCNDNYSCMKPVQSHRLGHRWPCVVSSAAHRGLYSWNYVSVW